MKRALATKIALLVLLTLGLTASLSCDTVGGGAEICLKGVTTGEVSMKGKPVTGLPSKDVDVVLKIKAERINISTSGEETIIEVIPSGASIVIGPDGISITGVEPDQIDMEWQAAE